jgi:hypothetical protein
LSVSFQKRTQKTPPLPENQSRIVLEFASFGDPPVDDARAYETRAAGGGQVEPGAKQSLWLALLSALV